MENLQLKKDIEDAQRKIDEILNSIVEKYQCRLSIDYDEIRTINNICEYSIGVMVRFD